MVHRRQAPKGEKAAGVGRYYIYRQAIGTHAESVGEMACEGKNRVAQHRRMHQGKAHRQIQMHRTEVSVLHRSARRHRAQWAEEGKGISI
jgi:hypothetical protein